jgi:2,4-dienoyl-CoA reductase-like NADH-dependent reductase (Old Yellow Enzyme family)
MFETPLELASMRVRNRIVMPAMLLNYAADDGSVSDRLIDFFVARGRGGAGLLMTEACYARAKGGISTRGISAYDERFLPGLSELAGRVHETGAAAGVQLFFNGAGRKFATPDTVSIGPSDLTPWGGIWMRPLTTAEIEEMRDAFIYAADLVFAAGFDCVEIHMSHGHFLGRFVSPYFNRRTDEYGGDLQRRTRLSREIVAGIRSRHPERPIFMRISMDERLPGGIDHAEAVRIVGAVAPAGITAVNASVGLGTTPYGLSSVFPGGGLPDAPYVDLLAAFAQEVDLPIISGGALRHPQDAERTLEAGASLVNVGRALLADPDLPRKWIAGDTASVRPCAGCNEECSDNLLNKTEVICSLNPWLSYEARLDRRPRAERRLDVVVAGGGPAGLNAALAAAEAGHRVTVLEAGAACGGRLALVAALPGRERYGDYATWLEREARGAGVEIELNAPAAAEQLASADAVVSAIGAEAAVAAGRRDWVTPCRPYDRGIDVPQGARCLVVGRQVWAHAAAQQLAAAGATIAALVPEGPAAMYVMAHEMHTDLAARGIPIFDGGFVEEVVPGAFRITCAGTITGVDAIDMVIDVGSLVPRVLPVEGAIRVGDALGGSTIGNAVRQGAFVAGTLAAWRASLPQLTAR